jgi:hypothetical protein
MNSRHILVDAISLGTRAKALAPRRLERRTSEGSGPEWRHEVHGQVTHRSAQIRTKTQLLGSALLDRA